ncbi:MAG: hypothetical protein ACLU6Y_15840 [Ruminococcus sp.]
MPVRCMGDPWQYGRPAARYDRYYYPETDSPVMDNDYGGVHINSSLIGYAGYQLCAEGLPKGAGLRAVDGNAAADDAYVRLPGGTGRL